MPAPVKMTAAISGVLIRDLPGYLNLARQRGLKAPAFDLEFLDGLSLKDANALRQALMQWRHEAPQVERAWNDVSHPDHAALHGYQTMCEHFLAIHPRDATGALKAWDRPMSLGLQRALETGMDLPTDFLPAHEAQDLRLYLTMRSDLTSAYHDKSHPQHAAIAREVEALAERAAAPPEPSVADAIPQQAAAGNAPAQPQAAAADARQQINELLADPEFKGRYFDKRQPGHAEAVAQMAHLHEALIPGNAAASSTAPAQAATSNILPDTARPIGVVASGAVSRPAAIALTERLKTGGLRGQARLDVLNALAAELGSGQTAAAEGDQTA